MVGIFFPEGREKNVGFAEIGGIVEDGIGIVFFPEIFFFGIVEYPRLSQ